EVLSGTALLPVVRGRGETEGARQEVAVDVLVVGRDGLDQLVDELLMPFCRLEDRHGKSLLPRFSLTATRNSRRRRESLRGERFPFMRRRRQERKAARLARMLVALDCNACEQRGWRPR